MEFNIENVRHEIEAVKKKPMTASTLEWFILLSRAKKYLCRENPTLSEEDAKRWVAHMDPPARWTKDQTTTVMHGRGYNYDPWVFYVAMNAIFSDFGQTLIRHGVDNIDMWAELAHDFIDDMDADENKVARYWRDIVRK